ncbi:MAG: tail fiber domain-containing protein [bacterium]|nr:tail fiber domain-containing protein [bacterium]
MRWHGYQSNYYRHDQFLVRASGGLKFTHNTHTSGVTMASGGNAWVVVSDSTKKRDIKLTDIRNVLEKIAELPVKDWEYKSETEGTKHLGPMAQDFWNAFHLGSDSLGIATNDADGVLFAAVKELAKEVVELRAEIQTLRAANQESMNIERK